MIVAPRAGRAGVARPSVAADGRVGEEREPQEQSGESPRAARPRSPLIIGAVAYGLLIWMVLVVCLLIAWRLSTRN